MPDNLEQQLDSYTHCPEVPPLPDAIVTRARSIRRTTAARTIAVASAPVVIITIALTVWLAIPKPTPVANDHKIATTNTDEPTIALEDATPANLLRINQNLNPEHLILPQTYSHTTSTTPLPTARSLLRIEMSGPPSP